jgi:hypothetical protein
VVAVSAVDQDARRPVERRHHDVEEAVAAQVPEGRAALVAEGGEVRPQLLRDVLEAPALEVAEHRVALGAVRGQVVDVAVRRVDVLPAVVVVVDEPVAPAREAEAQAHHPGGRRGVEKPLPPVVPEESPHLHHQVVAEDVHAAVVVVVLGVRPHPGDGRALVVVVDVPGRGLLRKGPVAAVQVEEVGLGVVGDEDVHPPVVVEVGDGDPHALAVPGGGEADGSLTSLKRPPPSLWYSVCGTLSYRVGEQ